MSSKSSPGQFAGPDSRYPVPDPYFRRLCSQLLCWCAVVFFLLAGSGCTTGLSGSSSQIELPARFSSEGGAPLPDQWWQALGDEVLDDLMDRALTGNLNLKIAWARLNQAQAQARISGAGIFPSLEGQAGLSRSWLHESGRTDDNGSYRLALLASYEVDLWGRIRSQRDAALLDATAGQQELQAAALTLSAQVATTWYQFIEQNGQARILEQQIQTNTQLLELIRLKVRTGQAGIADLLQQQQLIQTSRGELARLRSRAQVLGHQLAVLLGLPPDRPVAPGVDSLPALPLLPETGLPAELVQRRPDIRAAWARLQAADQRLSVAAAERFPRLSLSGQLGSEAENIGDLFDNWLATLAGNLIGPIIDGGRRRAEMARTQAVVAEELHSYGQIVLNALTEVEDALVRERQQLLYIEKLERQQLLAEQAIERIRDRYINGGEDYQRVLTAQLSLQGVQRNRLTAQRELYEFRIQLCRALAGSWELEPSASLNRVGRRS